MVLLGIPVVPADQRELGRRGVDIIQKIAANIVSGSLMFRFILR